MPEETRKIITIVSGTIATGMQQATALGFPTINLAYKNGEGPEAGIYAGLLVYDGEEYPGAVCIAPNGKLEIHCFGTVPITNIQEASIVFFKRLSAYVNGSEDRMKAKIARDVVMAKQFFVDSENGSI